MKHLLNGVAIAAALAIAAPALAQAPSAPAAPAAPPAAPAAPAAAPAAPAAAPAAKAPAPKAAAHKQMHKRPVRHAAGRTGRGHPASADNALTQRLNQEELARLQGGAPMPPPGSPFKKGQ